MNGFGKRLKELRVAAGLSQEKLANQLQVTVKSIQRYESGYRPDTYVLVQLATYFNVSADYLLGLKNEKELQEERNQKLKGENGYSELYSNYIKCLNNYDIMKDATYYWIELEDNYIGGQTEWVGWFDEDRKLEIRRLRPVKPEGVIKMCAQVNGKLLVINSHTDAIVFLTYGGQAIVREDICKKYLPEFLKDYIVANSDLFPSCI